MKTQQEKDYLKEKRIGKTDLCFEYWKEYKKQEQIFKNYPHLGKELSREEKQELQNLK